MVGGVEMPVESDEPAGTPAAIQLHIQLLGPLAIYRGSVALALPASRKLRALLAYLALAPRPVARSQLCELLWDIPNDPRGELRWCLSKLRSIVDGPGRRRVQADGDALRLDLSDCSVDAAEIGRAIEEDICTLVPQRQRTLASRFRGDFLEGLEIDRNPSFDGWLAAQRRRFRACHIALLEQLVHGSPEQEASAHLDKWLELAPFDQRAHQLLLRALARQGRIREGEEHLAVTTRLFDAEGLDAAGLRETWRGARARAETVRRPDAPISGGAGPWETSPSASEAAPRRASIAVMPFVGQRHAAGHGGGSADALAHDVITRLAKLRSLFVIAQGTVFALHEQHVGPEEAGRMLNVDYVVGGAVRRDGARLTVSVELSETRTARIVWAEIFDQKADDAFLVLDEIGNRIVASIASEIEAIERNRAILRPPNSLDAWEAHHRGLWHMYRFNCADNERARHFFEMAVRRDPAFARAYAGLSFTHFQSAFQGWEEREPAVDRAFEAAGQSLMIDDRDPAAHWAMGRALWLRGRHEQSITELSQAIDLSPNFALGHYTLAFVEAQSGDPSKAIESADYSRQLSPFDPLLFAMLASRAVALARLGRFAEAADWGVKAAARPNAHAQILAVAAYSLALAERFDEARAYLAAIHKSLPRYGIADFLTAFQFTPEGAALFRRAAERL